MISAGKFTVKQAIAIADTRLSVHFRTPTEESLEAQSTRCASIPTIGDPNFTLGTHPGEFGGPGMRDERYAAKLNKCIARYAELELQHEPIHTLAENAVRGILKSGQTIVTSDQLEVAISNAIATYEASTVMTTPSTTVFPRSYGCEKGRCWSSSVAEN